MREASQLMQRQGLGAWWSTGLSSSILFKLIVKQDWQIEKIRVALDSNGCGEMSYRMQREGYDCHFVRFANNICEEQREDRGIAEGGMRRQYYGQREKVTQQETATTSPHPLAAPRLPTFAERRGKL